MQADPELVALGLLVNRRDELGRTRTELLNRIHRLLLELVPGGAKRERHWVPDFAVADTGGTHRIAELARDGRPLLADLTDGGTVAAAITDIADQLTVAAGQPVGEVPATAVLIRPDGYVAWATSQPRPDRDTVGRLRGVLAAWFGI
ncbi:hypothetical protein ACFYXQ_45695 [Nocardia jiangxiensis]|uniref:Uncharacterized protein n=1 Tax=Nocardia jiangxiensis TaxID=282685 RepID=A0ABW6SFL8_9NOCA